MSLANPRWGAPRIHGELLKIAIAVSQATVAKYMVRHRKPPSQTWRTFLKNHVKDLVSADFFVVPTITFQLLFVFVILDHDRRRPIHFAVTSNPTAEWTARQLFEAFPWDNAPRYLLRDRDSIYGEKFCETAKWMGIREVLTAPRSPWQNAYAERLIGSIRRECLDHVLVFREAGLRQTLKQYFAYYERCRTHLSLKKDAPVGRPVEPPSFGEVIQIPQVGGLHHPYTRKAARSTKTSQRSIENAASLALVCDAKSSFLRKGARDPRFDPGRNGHGVPLTSLVGGQLSFW